MAARAIGLAVVGLSEGGREVGTALGLVVDLSVGLVGNNVAVGGAVLGVSVG